MGWRTISLGSDSTNQKSAISVVAMNYGILNQRRRLRDPVLMLSLLAILLCSHCKSTIHIHLLSNRRCRIGILHG